jgi:predicted DNA-binding ribbon-helix-helix protein
LRRKLEGEGVTVCAYMEKSVYETLRRIAYERHTTVSAVIREIVKKHLSST